MRETCTSGSVRGEGGKHPRLLGDHRSVFLSDATSKGNAESIRIFLTGVSKNRLGCYERNSSESEHTQYALPFFGNALFNPFTF